MEAIVSVQYKEEQKVGDDQEVFTGAIWVKFWEVERCRRWPGSIHWSSPSEILSRRWSRIRWRSPSENRRSNDERWVLEKNLVGVERGRRWSGFHWSSPSENRRCNDERHGSSWSGDSLWIYLFVQVSRPPDKNTFKFDFVLSTCNFVLGNCNFILAITTYYFGIVVSRSICHARLQPSQFIFQWP